MLNHQTREKDSWNGRAVIGGNAGVLVLPEIGIPEELTPLDNYALVRYKYTQCKRVTSIATLAARGLPVLKGFVTRTISEKVLHYLEFWMHYRRMERLMLLFDSSQTVDLPSPLAVTFEELQQITTLLHNSVVVMILEENDQLKQNHSVLTFFSDQYILCEVVGPGFEANDLTRGHISPHERLFFRRKDKDDDRYRKLRPGDLIDHFIIEQEDYLQSVQLRYSKIHHMLCRRPDEATRLSLLTEGQKQEVEALLEQRSSTLLDHKNRYTPISDKRLRDLYGYISELDVFYPDEVRGKVVVASFLQSQQLVFWGSFGSRHEKMLSREG